MSRIDDALSVTSGGVILSVEVSAGSRKSRFPAGFNPWRKTVLCRVTAPPVGGKANAAVLALIAETLGLPLHVLSIHAGATSPMKKILVAGVEKQDLAQQIERILQ